MKKLRRRIRSLTAHVPRPVFWLGFLVGIASIVGISVTAIVASTGSQSSSESAQALRPVVAAASAMAVLGQPRAPTDAVPSELDSLIAHLTPDDSVAKELDPGRPNVSQSHLLLTHVGTQGGDVYAFNTDKGSVCFIFTAGPYAGCVPTFGGQVPIPHVVVDPDDYFRGEPTEVFGLVPDSVSAIDVVVNNEDHPAKIANNAYFYQLSSNSSYPSALIVHYMDGQTTRVSIAPLPAE